MANPGYFSDMQVVDSRLTKLEEGYDKIIKLLNDMMNDLSKINGGCNNGIKEETKQGSKSKSKVPNDREMEIIPKVEA